MGYRSSLPAGKSRATRGPASASATRALLARGAVAAATLLCGPAGATPVLGVPTTSVPSPQPLGATVTITASATDADPGTLSYRYQIGLVGGSTLSMARDFSVDTSFVFTPTTVSGQYQIVVTARNNSTLKTATSTVSPFTFKPLVTKNKPVVTKTANPLVAIFSSPPCETGGVYMQVSVLESGTTTPFVTNTVNCAAGQDLNFLIAGMVAATSYTMQSQTWNGTTFVNGPTVTFKTGKPSVNFPPVSVVVPFTSQDDQSTPFMLMSLSAPQIPIAINLGGKPVWYYEDPSGTTPTITRPVPGGTILMHANGLNSAGTSVFNDQIVREIDLAGNILHETNATRVSEQVVALSGIQSSCYLGGTDCLVGGFHHEAIRLPNGHTLVLASEEKIFTDGTQGSSPPNPVDIIGDIIVDLDTDWQVVWYWRSFDWLNANRAAPLGETCAPGDDYCPPLILTTGVAQDWLHGNALFYIPADGNILFSMRDQDWVDKIEYGNGTGQGNVIWTMGIDGDFAINSTNSFPWFSHQHDPGYEQNGTTVLALYDNGNTRVAPPPIGLGHGQSRGYVLSVDEANMTVTPTLLTNLGFFSEALGTAEQLPNGDYHFESGFAYATPTYNQSIEVFPNGTLGFTLQLNGIRCYRNFRLPNFYSPPLKD